MAEASGRGLAGTAGAQDAAGLAARLEALERRLAGHGDPRFEASPAADARLGAVALALADGSSADDAPVARRPHEPFTAASTIKVYVLQALLEAVAGGDHDLDERVELRAEDQVTGSGVLKVLSPGTSYPLLDVATLMIVVSDNTATNLLIDLLGVERIRQVVADRGWSGTHLRGKLQVAAVAGDQKPTPSRTTPRDLADYFARLWRGELLPDDLTALAKRIYARQQFTELGRAIGYDQYSAEVGDSPVVIASKSGSVRGVRNDAGVIAIGEPGGERREVVVAVMTEGCPDRRFHPENLGAQVVGAAVAEVLGALEPRRAAG